MANTSNKPKKSVGRPKSDKYDIAKMIKIIEKYTDETDLPILKEVCYKNSWYYDYVMELQRKHEKLTHSIKRLLAKKEVELERGGLTGKYQQTQTIFSLKQLGWTDNKESSDVSNNNRVVIVNSLPKDEDDDK